MKLVEKRYLTLQTEVTASCDFLCRPETCRTDLDSYVCTKHCCTEDYCNNTNGESKLNQNICLLYILVTSLIFDHQSIFDNI